MSAARALPEPLPVGVLKTFGPTGPMYEVLGEAGDGAKGAMVRVRIFFTGEEFDYPLLDMLADPYKP